MKYFGKNIDQHYVNLNMEVNVIETNLFFLQKEGIN